MADNSKIEWTEASWNPVTGCTQVSPGCDHCYAETFAERWRGKTGHYFEQGFDVQLRPAKLDQPLRWKRPRRIFVNSMSDLFHEDVPTAFIAEVFAVMAKAKQHTFQLLTKRHGRMRSLLGDDGQSLLSAAPNEDTAQALYEQWPLPNVWLGVSVETQRWADIRIPALLETPAAVRWISAEPLLGPVELRTSHCPTHDFPGGFCTFSCPERRKLDWVVCGGESGPGARPMDPNWARSLRDQCTDAGIPFFFKQWGEWCRSEQMPQDTARDLDAAINLAQMHPEPHRVGKKRAGRLLDEREWNEYPAGVR